MLRQLNLSRFTKPNSTTPNIPHQPVIKASTDVYFTPQGYSNHIKSHQLNPNARPVKKAKPGRVKLRDLPNPRNAQSRTSRTSRNQDLSSSNTEDSTSQDPSSNTADTSSTGIIHTTILVVLTMALTLMSSRIPKIQMRVTNLVLTEIHLAPTRQICLWQAVRRITKTQMAVTNREK